MTRMLRTIGGMVLTVLMLVMVAALAVAIVPSAFGYGSFIVRTGSMAPTVPVGAVALTRPTSPADLRVGDVVVMSQPAGAGTSLPRMHRIVSIDQSGPHPLLRTQGDANPTVDPQPFVAEAPLPVMAYSVPHVGRAAGFVSTPLGWLLVMVFPATVLAASTFLRIWCPTQLVHGSAHGSDRPPTGARTRADALGLGLVPYVPTAWMRY